MRSSEDPYPVDSLKQALTEYMNIPGIKAAMFVSDQGLVIRRAACDDVDTASIAALVIDTVATAQRFGLQVEAGFLETMSIEFADLTVVLAPFTSDVMLALVATPGILGSTAASPTPVRIPKSVAASSGAPQKTSKAPGYETDGTRNG